MNKKILIIAGIVTILIILGGLFIVLSKNTESGSGGFWGGLPFGSSENSSIPPPQTSPGTVDQVVLTELDPKIRDENGLKKISDVPVSGSTFLQSSTSTEHNVRFIERATGHIYDANLETGNITRVSNTTIPKIEFALWREGGNSFLAQTIDSGILKTKIYEIVEPTGTTTSETFARIDEFSLQDNIFSPTISSQNQIFYLARGISGIEGFVANSRGENPRKVWEFPTSEWLSQTATQNMIALTSKASNSLDGLLYFVNTTNGATSLIISNIPGLTTKVSPSGEIILYSGSEGSSSENYFYNRVEKTGYKAPFDTLPEKCVWTENETELYCFQPKTLFSNLPDSWYQGVVSFNDRLWQTNVSTGETRLVSELQTLSGQYVDAINPAISSDGKYILFTNKKDLTLWAVPTGK